MGWYIVKYRVSGYSHATDPVETVNPEQAVRKTVPNHAEEFVVYPIATDEVGDYKSWHKDELQL